MELKIILERLNGVVSSIDALGDCRLSWFEIEHTNLMRDVEKLVEDIEDCIEADND